ncbi:MAG: PAS domain-containing protein [Alphaproteobacteria bacterium]|nr:PAS domain-containing protein [Alphaproteobacteria bacterium]
MDKARQRLTTLREFWDKKRDANALPRRGDFDPKALRPWIGNLALVEIVPDGEMHFRLCGTNLYGRLGGEFTGRAVNALPQETRSNNLEILVRTTQVVSAYVQKNAVPVGELPAFIKSVYTSMRGLAPDSAPAAGPALKPAVPIRRSVTENHIVCLEDGKKLKMLKRYLRSRFNLSPDEYRAKWGLPVDYPMVAPNYAAQRSAFAKRIGLGRSPARTRQRRRGSK